MTAEQNVTAPSVRLREAAARVEEAGVVAEGRGRGGRCG